MRKIYAAVKGSMRTTARAPTALAKRWTVRMDGVPLPLSMRATTLWVVPMRAATSPCASSPAGLSQFGIVLGPAFYRWVIPKTFR